MIKYLLNSLFFGALIGLSTASYMIGLEKIADFHIKNSMYPMFLIIVFVIIYFIKRFTLYFPTTVHEVMAASDVEQKHWNSFSYLLNLLGSWMSHFAGASLGREGTVIVLTASLTHSLKLNWNYFKPVIVSAALACATGQPLLALVIISELFKTRIDQKIFSLIMTWVAVLILKSFNVQPLFSEIIVDLNFGFWMKILIVFMIAINAGLLSQLYKKAFFYLLEFFKKNRLISATVVIALTWLLIQPQFKIVHSLSLDMFKLIQNGESDWHNLFLKYSFTLLFVSLGFIGGDFVPLIVIGSGFGVLIANKIGVPYTFGLSLGLMSFFTGTTRLKWTSLCLVYLLSGFTVTLWAYLCLSMVRYFSGPLSLYKKSGII